MTARRIRLSIVDMLSKETTVRVLLGLVTVGVFLYELLAFYYWLRLARLFR